MIKVKERKINSPILLVVMSFAIIILIGTFLLCCPFSNTDGKWGSFLDNLFSSTSATCVTGLNVYEDGIGEQFTFFGELVMLIMIQIGGLGFITILTFLITLVRKKIQFKDRLFLAKAVNANSLGDMIKFVRKIIIISLTVEFVGFLLCLPAFLSMYKNDVLSAIWTSIFHSISSFNNAGFDIIGNVSLTKGMGNALIDSMENWAYIYLQIVTMILIVLGGLSFLVIIEVFSFKKNPKQYTTFTKIVLSTTAFLLVFGTLAFLLSEGFKPYNKMSFLDALFQSVTCRTAGFSVYNQANLSVSGRVISCLLMFIGGSPLSTAGGIKTTTAFLIGLAMYKYLRGKQVSAFKRSYSSKMVLKAMSLLLIALAVLMISYLAIVGFEWNNPNITDRGAIIFEVFSAFGTVGLSTGITTSIGAGTKIIICLLMFLGRLGPITMFQVFQKNMDIEEKLHYNLVEEDFLIG
ncbi:MAG: TrkH family potassium uptake protein [Bacilli bacterium]